MTLDLDVEPVVLSVEQAAPCGLILNELATDALRHAFTGRHGCEGTTNTASMAPEPHSLS